MTNDFTNEQGWNIVPAAYRSIWDGGIQVTGSCKVNLNTGEVFDVNLDVVDGVNIEVLDAEFVKFADGEEEEVFSSDVAHIGELWRA